MVFHVSPLDNCGGFWWFLDGGYLLLVRERLGCGGFDLRQLQVDGLPGVVQSRGLQDDARRPNQNSHREDPEEQSMGGQLRSVKSDKV